MTASPHPQQAGQRRVYRITLITQLELLISCHLTCAGGRRQAASRVQDAAVRAARPLPALRLALHQARIEGSEQ